ncbi:family 20 glycosylhydrolase [Mucilaginibacter gynuensis]|uniref:beta-N-acetylhexosaminidase n=1 Tax=Mucilaginibacter gynuensis TaxID=1302236 RepID=A0ABP8FV24_9SPHI
MKKTPLYILLLLLFAVNTSAQNKTPFNVADLKLTWQSAEENHLNSGDTHVILTLSNKGKKPIPASGWSIYFNTGGAKSAGIDSNIIVKQVNGDVFKLSPGKSFALRAGGVLKSDLRTGNIKNATDFPKGFYLVFDKQPGKGFPIKTEFDNTANIDEREKQLAEKVYNQNQLIKSVPENELPPVLPTPVKYTRELGTFNLTSAVKISTAAVFAKEARYLASELSKVLGKAPAVATGDKSAGIMIEQDKAIAPEAYELKVTSSQITIMASTATGAFYGIQSLKLLLPPTAWASVQQDLKISNVIITDAPRFGHRAFMMDIARNFQQKQEVIKLIDLLSLYKFNVLHLHLNDDEGWRIQIPGLPELTEIGSQRGHTINAKNRLHPSYGSGPDAANKAGSGFYTRADYIEILKYANDRHIKVIPEFETPGHARAAIKSMDVRYDRLMKAGKAAEANKYLLRDVNDKSVYRSVQGWDDNVINVALPSVYTFLTKVTDEIIAMHKEAGVPLETIHFGGDEVPAGVWEKSPAVANVLKQDTSVKNVDEMWHYYFSKINTMLKARKLYLSGWEEVGLRKVTIDGKKQMIVDTRMADQNIHVDVWNNLSGNEELAYKLANAGYKVVLTNVTNLYLDLAYNESISERGQYWGGYVDMNKPYAFIPYNYYKNQKENEEGKPIPAGYFDNKLQLTDAGRANILGIQAPLWSETLISADKFEYLLLPKLFAVAERAWAVDPDWATEKDVALSESMYNTAWSTFANKVARELPRLNNYAGGFNYRVPTPGAIIKDGNIEANMQLPGFVLRYTTNGSIPTNTSKIFSGKIPAAGNTIKLRAFGANGRSSSVLKLN